MIIIHITMTLLGRFIGLDKYDGYHIYNINGKKDKISVFDW